MYEDSQKTTVDFYEAYRGRRMGVYGQYQILPQFIFATLDVIEAVCQHASLAKEFYFSLHDLALEALPNKNLSRGPKEILKTR
jgi:hypothetical protein